MPSARDALEPLLAPIRAELRALREELRARAGRTIAEGWRTIEGSWFGERAVLIQRLTGERTWVTVQGFGLDGRLLNVTGVTPAGGRLTVYTLATRPAANAANRGTKILLSDPGYMDGADVEQTCVRTSTGVHEWAAGPSASS